MFRKASRRFGVKDAGRKESGPVRHVTAAATVTPFAEHLLSATHWLVTVHVGFILPSGDPAGRYYLHLIDGETEGQGGGSLRVIRLGGG